MKKTVLIAIVILLLLSVVATGIQRSQVAGSISDNASTRGAQASEIIVPKMATNSGTPVSTIALPNFAEIVQRVGPAVVHIAVEAKVASRNARNPFGNIDPNDPFFEFFKRFMPEQGAQQERKVQGMGSGFIVSEDGLVYTNAHVVDGADKITVKLTDQREFEGTVIGVDKATDVALVKIEAKELPIVVIGNPADVLVGEWVLAIGAPFGFENSVTAGIVSAKSRSLPDESYVPFIQTDVAINPGNSGGPLLNLNGEVIGVNSQIYSRSGGYQGLSFAIPIDVVNRVSTQLQKNGKVSRGYLGVSIQPLTQELASSFGMKDIKGALITSIEKGSAAEKAGLQVSDIILKFNGQMVKDAGSLPPLVGALTPGEKAEIVVWRNGKEKSVEIAVGELNSDVVSASAKPDESSIDSWGLQTRNLSNQEKQEAGVEQGVLITDVEDSAANSGLRAGDIILAVNGKEIDSVTTLKDALSEKKKSAALLVQRGNGRLFVPITRK